MSEPLSKALSKLCDADRARRAATETARASWSDAAQRTFWDRILSEIDREAQQYRATVTALDNQLQSALNMLDE